MILGCTKEGPIGKKSLIDMTAESKGQNCNSGGFKIMSGIDLNNNDILDENEIQIVKYICNGNDGANGTNGYNGIFKVAPELSGSNCSEGGYKISSGMDLNINGKLDDNEIQTSQFICNGLDGEMDRKISIYFDGSFSFLDARTTTWKIEDLEWIQNFDISRYLNIDSIAFGIYLRTYDTNSSITVELYDMTHNAPIDNTTLSSNSLDWEWKTTSINFIDKLPIGPIKIAVRAKTQLDDSPSGYYVPMITLYRK